MNLIKFNQHWNNNFRYDFPYKRKLLKTLEKQLYNRQIIELTGLRRVGKTTLLLQLINTLLEQKVPQYNIWYFSFDEQRYDLDELLSDFVAQTKRDIVKDKIYIFFDEIQKLKNFQAQIKIYYDLYPNLKFFISGSTSLFIKKQVQESLAGRVFSFMLKPLDFKEYLLFKNNSKYLEMPEMFETELKVEYNNYLSRQFIETVNISDDIFVKEYVTGIIKKVIYEDIPTLFSVENPEILFAIVRIIAERPGLYLHFENLANDLKISAKTLSKYLSILEQAFLITILYNYSANQLTSEKKMKRAYLASASFCTALNDFNEVGLLVENAILSLNPYQFFWRDPYKHEVDFIDIRDKEVTPIEIKYKNKISKQDYNNLYLFAKKFKLKKATLLTNIISNYSFEYKGIEIEVKSIYDLEI